jgi:hypothetical protein
LELAWPTYGDFHVVALLVVFPFNNHVVLFFSL